MRLSLRDAYVKAASSYFLPSEDMRQADKALSDFRSQEAERRRKLMDQYKGTLYADEHDETKLPDYDPEAALQRRAREQELIAAKNGLSYAHEQRLKNDRNYAIQHVSPETRRQAFENARIIDQAQRDSTATGMLMMAPGGAAIKGVAAVGKAAINQAPKVVNAVRSFYNYAAPRVAGTARTAYRVGSRRIDKKLRDPMHNAKDEVLDVAENFAEDYINDKYGTNIKLGVLDRATYSAYKAAKNVSQHTSTAAQNKTLPAQSGSRSPQPTVQQPSYRVGPEGTYPGNGGWYSWDNDKLVQPYK